ncbi:hypothetical protein [Brevundimonas sp.]|uniref:hypothetical protein n=1 Tax=Brevundimonas sp. TaxID=1871086 RepID=UPI001DB5200A|nr:hypothetical protein [Brevundimonas sp.]MBL0947723.1 hypothetical protein [Brevundimonas sp.]
MVTREPVDDISLTRALAILAATFAIVFASLLPSAVAASAATDTPVQLCSGQIVRIGVDADGHPVPVDDDDRAGLTCAMALLSGLQAVDVPPVTLAAPPAELRAVAPAPVPETDRPAARHPPKPPATAPPHA